MHNAEYLADYPNLPAWISRASITYPRYESDHMDGGRGGAARVKRGAVDCCDSSAAEPGRQAPLQLTLVGGSAMNLANAKVAQLLIDDLALMSEVMTSGA